MANPPTDTTKEVKNQVPRAPWNIPGAMGYLKESFESEIVSGFPKEGTIYFNAAKDLVIESILGLEKTPVPNAFQKAFEGEDASKLDPQARQEQIGTKAAEEEALAHNRRIIQSIEDLQRQKGENLFKTAQRVLETDPNSIIENSLRKSSKERIKGVVKPPKLASDNPFKIAKQRASLHDYDIYYEAKQQEWVEEEVEEVESQKSLAETQPVVNMNAIMEGGTGGAKANISQTGGGAG